MQKKYEEIKIEMPDLNMINNHENKRKMSNRTNRTINT